MYIYIYIYTYGYAHQCHHMTSMFRSHCCAVCFVAGFSSRLNTCLRVGGEGVDFVEAMGILALSSHGTVLENQY